MKIELLKTEYPKQKSNCQSVVIGKIETYQITHENGKIETNSVYHWYDWQTQKLVRVS